MDIYFEIVIPTPNQIKALYDELKVRKYTISHDRLPRYEDHESFVRSKPYRYWWIISYQGAVIGSCYLGNENSIGINIRSFEPKLIEYIINYIIGRFEPLDPIPSIRPNEFFINIPVSNSEFIDTMEQLGYPQTQISYRLSKQSRASKE